MRIDLKAWAAIVGTLVLGIVIGLLLNGTLARRRAHEVERMRRPGGFVEQMERVIQPRDSAQAAQLRPFLETTDRRNRQIVDGARVSMRAELDSMRTRLTGILDADQLKRLSDFAERGPEGPRGRGRPGGGGPGGGGPGGFGPRHGPPGNGQDGNGPPGNGPPALEGGPPPPKR